MGTKAAAERTEQGIADIKERRELPQTTYRACPVFTGSSLQTAFVVHQPETVFVLNDKGKTPDKRGKVRIAELNKLNRLMKPRKGNRRCRKRTFTHVIVKSVKGNLVNTVYAASGVKAAGRQYRVRYGTREAGAALLILYIYS